MYSNPPPLFKQGTSARVKVVLFSLIAIMLLVIDAHLHTLNMARQLVNSVLYPVQMLALMPRDAARTVGHYFTRLSTLEKENTNFQRIHTQQALELQQGRQLQQENAQLRQLLGATQKLAVKTFMATILYDARDSFNRRIIVDHGKNHGVALGQPVMDDQGLVGQITRVFALTSEVTLLTDKDQMVPVQVQRNGLRSVVYGKGQIGNLDMRVPSGADINVGDLLVTSGLDGIYPEGLSVARVTRVENNATSSFEHIICAPIAGLDRHKEVLILLVDTHIAPHHVDEEKKIDEANKPKKVNRRITRDDKEPREAVQGTMEKSQP